MPQRNNASATLIGRLLLGVLVASPAAYNAEENEKTNHVPPSYSVTEIGTFGGSFSGPWGMNNKGQVLGDASTGEPDPFFGERVHGSFWDKGKLIELPTAGGWDSIATSVNDNGIAAGGSQIVPGNDTHVTMIWDKEHAIHEIGVLAGVHSAAYGINNRGQLAGHTSVAEFDPNTGHSYIHAYFWEKGVFTDLGTLGGHYSDGSELNDRAQVVGTAETADLDPNFGFNTVHAFLWENGVMRDLGTAGGFYSGALSINERGQVLMFSTISTVVDPAVGWYAYRGFVWENGSFTDLGGLPGGQNTYPIGLNDRGQVVGAADAGDPSGLPHAFLWDNGRMVDLNSLIPHDAGWLLVDASQINNSGEIAGVGFARGRHPCLLSPTNDHIEKSRSYMPVNSETAKRLKAMHPWLHNKGGRHSAMRRDASPHHEKSVASSVR